MRQRTLAGVIAGALMVAGFTGIGPPSALAQMTGSSPSAGTAAVTAQTALCAAMYEPLAGAGLIPAGEALGLTRACAHSNGQSVPGTDRAVCAQGVDSFCDPAPASAPAPTPAPQR